jgi:3-oxoacyl-[acyl-carrier protein] reductase
MRSALVTGASRGIGRACAIALAKDGCAIGANYVKGEKGCKETVDLISKMGGNAIPLKCDVSDWGQVQAMASEFIDAFGGIDILVNNAGIYERSTFDALTVEAFDRALAVNLRGTFLCCKALVPHMLKRGKGSIINLSSVLGEMGSTAGAHYSASKAGVIGLTKALARELSPVGVRVNAIAPGPIDTAIIANDTPEKRRSRESEIPLRRVGRSEEVADAVIFLASDRSSYVTGHVLDVNGGQWMG